MCRPEMRKQPSCSAPLTTHSPTATRPTRARTQRLRWAERVGAERSICVHWQAVLGGGKIVEDKSVTGFGKVDVSDVSDDSQASLPPFPHRPSRPPCCVPD